MVGSTIRLVASRIKTVTYGPEIAPKERATEIPAFLGGYDPAELFIQIDHRATT